MMEIPGTRRGVRWCKLMRERKRDRALRGGFHGLAPRISSTSSPNNFQCELNLPGWSLGRGD